MIREGVNFCATLAGRAFLTKPQIAHVGRCAAQIATKNLSRLPHLREWAAKTVHGRQ
jgi:hypothetical protein